MPISGIGYSSPIYSQLSSGRRINSAADDAAGSAIAAHLASQATQQSTQARNDSITQSALNVSDEALGSISDSLQRIRELSVQASNGTYTANDRSSIQDEINQLKEGISSVARNTEFNTQKLLDGSSSVGGVSNNATLDALGISDYDVTSGNFDIQKIDDAISMVSSMRSGTGATSNALDQSIAYERLSSQQMVSSQSAIEDLDIGSAVSELKKQQVLEQYQIFTQKAILNQQAQEAGLLQTMSMNNVQ
ncbi:MAG: flagellin [Lachnospiraceae bacterium]|nr:flagellin [Lachnospiraceae bacterium]